MRLGVAALAAGGGNAARVRRRQVGHFATQAGSAGDELAAAADDDPGSSTMGGSRGRYAQAAFVNYREVLQGFEPRFRQATGAPSDGEDRLVAVYHRAASVPPGTLHRRRL